MFQFYLSSLFYLNTYLPGPTYYLSPGLPTYLTVPLYVYLCSLSICYPPFYHHIVTIYLSISKYATLICMSLYLCLPAGLSMSFCFWLSSLYIFLCIYLSSYTNIYPRTYTFRSKAFRRLPLCTYTSRYINTNFTLYMGQSVFVPISPSARPLLFAVNNACQCHQSVLVMPGLPFFPFRLIIPFPFTGYKNSPCSNSSLQPLSPH